MNTAVSPAFAKLAATLRDTVATTLPSLKSIYRPDWYHRPRIGAWSKIEILGHLIDSAANNHQRFVRIQFEDNPAIGYAQNDWVRTQDYFHAESESLLDLWAAYNRHLAHVISRIPEVNADLPSRVGDKTVTLGFLVSDYIEHMRHHLEQLLGVTDH